MQFGGQSTCQQDIQRWAADLRFPLLTAYGLRNAPVFGGRPCMLVLLHEKWLLNMHAVTPAKTFPHVSLGLQIGAKIEGVNVIWWFPDYIPDVVGLLWWEPVSVGPAGFVSAASETCNRRASTVMIRRLTPRIFAVFNGSNPSDPQTIGYNTPYHHPRTVPHT